MASRRLVLLFPLLVIASAATGQSVLFDFENAPVHASLPIDLTVGGITAHFSATGQGFSIQPANTMGFTPAGFSGLCIYPSSIYAADLLVGFSTPLTSFSILYAPQELGCDDSATLRVTAYSGGTFVATATTTAAVPGTWPSQTLAISAFVPFDNVVVHYDARPPTCQDWGSIFMVDTMNVTPMPPPIVLVNGTKLTGGSVQFDFSYAPGATCNVWAASDPALPIGIWTWLAYATEISPGLYQFSDFAASLYPNRFYIATCP